MVKNKLLHTHTRTHAHTYGRANGWTGARTHSCSLAPTHARMYTPTHPPTHACTHPPTNTPTHGRTHTRTDECMYARTDVHMHGRTHTRTDAHTDTYWPWSSLIQLLTHFFFSLIFLLLLVYSMCICSVMRTCVFLFLDLYLQSVENLCFSFLRLFNQFYCCSIFILPLCFNFLFS